MNMLIFLTIAAIAAALLAVCKLMLAWRDESAGFESREYLFTPSERSFLGVLEQAVDGRYRVFGKVRLGDLVSPSRGRDTGTLGAAQNWINQKHVDFVVCTANELALVGVLELDDPARPERDESLDLALAIAGIPLLRFPAKSGYTVQEMRTRLSELMCGDTKSGVASALDRNGIPAGPVLDAIMESRPVQPDSAAPACPNCSSLMVKRQAVRGQNYGRYFWACSTFPMCRQVLDIGEA